MAFGDERLEGHYLDDPVLLAMETLRQSRTGGLPYNGVWHNPRGGMSRTADLETAPNSNSLTREEKTVRASGAALVAEVLQEPRES